MAPPITFASAQQYVGIAKEAVSQTPVMPTTTFPVTKFDVEDVTAWHDDKSLRGTMGEQSDLIQGTGHATFDLAGPVYGDMIGYLLANIFADVTVTGASAPFTSAFALLNGANTQGGTHTFTDFRGLTPTSGARQYPSSVLTDLSFKVTADGLFDYTAKGLAFPSVAAPTLPSNIISSVRALPGWRTVVGVGGPASGASLANNTTEFSLDIKRQARVVQTADGGIGPYLIRRGRLGITGKINFVALDEVPLNQYLTNAILQLQVLISNGLSGAAANTVQFDVAKMAYATTKPNASKEEVDWDLSFKCIDNATNAGASGALSPAKVTITNAVAAGTYQ